MKANPFAALNRQPGLLGRAVLPQLLDIPEQKALCQVEGVSACVCNLQVSGSFVQLWASAKKNAEMRGSECSGHPCKTQNLNIEKEKKKS